MAFHFIFKRWSIVEVNEVINEEIVTIFSECVRSPEAELVTARVNF